MTGHEKQSIERLFERFDITDEHKPAIFAVIEGIKFTPSLATSFRNHWRYRRCFFEILKVLSEPTLRLFPMTPDDDRRLYMSMFERRSRRTVA
jgi:hypothetical protein